MSKVKRVHGRDDHSNENKGSPNVQNVKENHQSQSKGYNALTRFLQMGSNYRTSHNENQPPSGAGQDASTLHKDAPKSSKKLSFLTLVKAYSPGASTKLMKTAHLVQQSINLTHTHQAASIHHKDDENTSKTKGAAFHYWPSTKDGYHTAKRNQPLISANMKNLSVMEEYRPQHRSHSSSKKKKIIPNLSIQQLVHCNSGSQPKESSVGHSSMMTQTANQTHSRIVADPAKPRNSAGQQYTVAVSPAPAALTPSKPSVQAVNCSVDSQLCLTSRNHIAKFNEANYEFGEQIGKGRFGEVYLARDIKNDLIFAIKMMNKIVMQKYRATKQLVREIRIHSILDHQNIIKCYGILQNEESVYILMEYAPEGNLYSKLKEVGKFDEATVAKYTKQVLNAFKYLQDRQILHRDLKPENLLIGTDDELKLADFGWAIQLPGTATMRQTFCGTLDYISPEMAQGEYYGIHTDNWSIGILVFELLTGSLPFVRVNVFDVMSQSAFGLINYPEEMSPVAKDFISRLLNQDPLKRMTLPEAINHPFVVPTTSK